DGSRQTDARPGAVSADKPAVSASVTAGASRQEHRSGEPDGQRGSAEGGPPTPAAAANIGAGELCSADGCSRWIQRNNRSRLCRTHYQRAYNAEHRVHRVDGRSTRMSLRGIAPWAEELAPRANEDLQPVPAPI